MCVEKSTLKNIRRFVVGSVTGALFFFSLHSGYSAGHPEAIYQDLENEVTQTMQRKLGKRDYEHFNLWFHTQFAFDRREVFVDQLRSSKKHKDGLLHRYNRQGEFPMDGYLAARKFLFSKEIQDITVDDLLSAHQLLLSKHSVRYCRFKGKRRCSERTAQEDIGVIRDYPAIPLDTGIEEIEKRPFPSLDGKLMLGQSVRTKADVGFINPFFAQSPDGKAGRDNWEFAPLSGWRNYGPISLDLHQKLAALDDEWATLDVDDPDFNPIRQKMLRQIWEQRLQKLKNQTAAAKSKEDRIRAVADYSYDMLSAHVLLNGQGRLTRLTIERFLAPEMRPLWLEWGYDYMLPKNEYLRHLKDSIELGGMMMNDLRRLVTTERLPQNLTEHWAYDLRTAEGNSTPEEREDFLTWSETVTLPKIKTFEEAKKLWVETIRGKFTYPSYNGSTAPDPNTPTIVRPASADFIDSFGRRSTNQESFIHKLNNFYNRDAVMFRGIPWDYRPSEQEMVDMLVKPDFSFTGMGLEADELLKDKERIFRKFNSSLLTKDGKVSSLTSGHTGGGSKWKESGFTSWSYDESVSREFSITGYDNSSPSSETKTAMFARSYPRKMASLKTFVSLPEIHPTGITSEKEVILYGGSDPESIKTIEFFDISWGSEGWQYEGRARLILRENFNRIKILEYRGKRSRINDKGKAIEPGEVVKEEIWTILPNGRSKRVSVQTFLTTAEKTWAEFIEKRTPIGATFTQKIPLEQFASPNAMNFAEVNLSEVQNPPDYSKFIEVLRTVGGKLLKKDSSFFDELVRPTNETSFEKLEESIKVLIASFNEIQNLINQPEKRAESGGIIFLISGFDKEKSNANTKLSKEELKKGYREKERDVAKQIRKILDAYGVDPGEKPSLLNLIQGLRQIVAIEEVKTRVAYGKPKAKKTSSHTEKANPVNIIGERSDEPKFYPSFATLDFKDSIRQLAAALFHENLIDKDEYILTGGPTPSVDLITYAIMNAPKLADGLERVKTLPPEEQLKTWKPLLAPFVGTFSWPDLAASGSPVSDVPMGVILHRAQLILRNLDTKRLLNEGLFKPTKEHTNFLPGSKIEGEDFPHLIDIDKHIGNSEFALHDLLIHGPAFQGKASYIKYLEGIVGSEIKSKEIMNMENKFPAHTFKKWHIEENNAKSPFKPLNNRAFKLRSSVLPLLISVQLFLNFLKSKDYELDINIDSDRTKIIISLPDYKKLLSDLLPTNTPETKSLIEATTAEFHKLAQDLYENFLISKYAPVPDEKVWDIVQKIFKINYGTDDDNSAAAHSEEEIMGAAELYKKPEIQQALAAVFGPTPVLLADVLIASTEVKMQQEAKKSKIAVQEGLKLIQYGIPLVDYQSSILSDHLNLAIKTLGELKQKEKTKAGIGAPYELKFSSNKSHCSSVLKSLTKEK